MAKLEQALQDAYIAELEKNAPVAHELNYWLADHPEDPGKEFEACRRYVDLCRAHGLSVEEKFCGLPTAFIAHAAKQKAPKCRIAILAEYDALPNIGHGCGHCASGALSLLTALSLRKFADQFQADVDLIGTPDEERCGEKAKMVNQGAFEHYDMAIMIHLNSATTYSFMQFLALSTYAVRFHGTPTHASATPWEGRSALNGLMLAIHGIDMLRQHVLPDTRMAYYISKGGEASNIVPKYAEMELCLRSGKRKYLDEVIARVKKCIDGAALATETTAEMELIGYHFSDMLLNQPGINALQETMDDLGIAWKPDDGSMLGSSDIANVSYVCPCFHPMLASSDHYFSMHSQDMVDVVKSEGVKEVINRGAKIMGLTLLKFMTDENLRKAIRDDFLAKR